MHSPCTTCNFNPFVNESWHMQPDSKGVCCYSMQANRPVRGSSTPPKDFKHSLGSEPSKVIIELYISSYLLQSGNRQPLSKERSLPVALLK